MKHRIGTVLKQIVCVALIMSLCGCWNARELDQLGIVMGVGLDVPAGAPDQVEFTAQIVKPGEIGTTKNGGGGGSGEKAYWNITTVSETVFSAVRELTAQSSRKLFFPHTDALIIGRSAAETGIGKYLDFFQRDHEVRSKIPIVVSETTAKDILDVKPELEKIPAANIQELIDQCYHATSQIPPVNLTEFVDRYMSATTAAVAPMVKIVQDGDEKTVEVSGTAVFKLDKMVGTLDKTEGRGLLWVLGKVKSGVIVVQDSQGGAVSAEIIRAKVEVEPILENGKLRITVKVVEEGNIGEADGTANVAELSEVAYLEDRIAEAIRSEISAALLRARALDADIFGFGDAVKQKYPKQWKEMEDNWDELFETLEVELEVEANLRLTGKISKPSVPEKG